MCRFSWVAGVYRILPIFVPRLKRKDLKQVIEEPAILSGNRISQRLIERLVYDIAEGVDQLPILQHALSQIWLMADHGRQEMDLIHYAMVGGMPADDLPDNELPQFNTWFDRLPAKRKNIFRRLDYIRSLKFMPVFYMKMPGSIIMPVTLEESLHNRMRNES